MIEYCWIHKVICKFEVISWIIINAFDEVKTVHNSRWITDRIIRVCYADGYQFSAARCEFVVDDLLSGDSDAYMSSSAFIPHVSFLLLGFYNISSSDIAVDLIIISELTDHVIRRYTLSREQNVFTAIIPSTNDPIRVLLHAYSSTSTATSSLSSVTIFMTLLPYNDS